MIITINTTIPIRSLLVPLEDDDEDDEDEKDELSVEEEEEFEPPKERKKTIYIKTITTNTIIAVGFANILFMYPYILTGSTVEVVVASIYYAIVFFL
jgi:hypothetical protein